MKRNLLLASFLAFMSLSAFGNDVPGDKEYTRNVPNPVDAAVWRKRQEGQLVDGESKISDGVKSSDVVVLQSPDLQSPDKNYLCSAELVSEYERLKELASLQEKQISLLHEKIKILESK